MKFYQVDLLTPDQVIAKDIEGKIVEISIEMEKEQRNLEVRTDCDDFLACINRVNI